MTAIFPPSISSSASERRAFKAAVFAACLLGLTGPALAETCAAPQLLNTVKLERLNDQGLVGMPVTLNGVEKKFLLDTGGGMANYISGAVAEELKLNLVAGRPSFDARGNTFDRVTTIRQVTLGSATIGNVRFGVAPDLGFDGVLSAGHFARRVLGEAGADLDIDFAAMRLNVYAPDHCAGAGITWPHQALAAVPVTLDQGHIQFPVTLDGQALTAIIDTGAPWTVFDIARARRKLGFTPTAASAPPGTPPDDPAEQIYFRQYTALAFEGVTIANPLMVLRPFSIGGGRNDPVNLGSRARHASADQRTPDIIIGMEVLRHLHLYYAANEEKLYITPATIPPPDIRPAASQN
jgi:predicted aspartyl protease